MTEALGFPTGCPLIEIARSRWISRIHQSLEHRLQARHSWSDTATSIVLPGLGGLGSHAFKGEQIFTEGARNWASKTKVCYDSSHQVWPVLPPINLQKFVKQLSRHFFALKLTSRLTRDYFKTIIL